MNSLLNLTLARSRFAPREKLTAMEESRRVDRVDTYNAILLSFLGIAAAVAIAFGVWAIVAMRGK